MRIPLPSFYFALSLFLYFHSEIQSPAQTNTNALSNIVTTVVSNAPAPPGPFEALGGFVKKLFSDDGMLDALSKFVAIVFTLLVAYLAARVHKLKRWISGPRFAMPTDRTDHTNRVLMAAIGGTGKTTTIRNMMHNLSADPRKKTGGDVVTYSMVIETIANNVSKVTRIDLDDYSGQNFGRLVDAVKSKTHDSDEVPFTSILLIVDLFEPPPDYKQKLPRADSYNRARVTEQKQEWKSQALEALWGLTGGKHKLFCLFINKVDLLEGDYQVGENTALKAYKPLIDLIHAQHSSGVRVEIIVGSAEHDLKLTQLQRLLIETVHPPV